MKEISKKLLIGKSSQEDLRKLLDLKDFSEIYKLANDIKTKYHSNIIKIRAILEFSNYCKRKCKYCGLNSTNNKIKRYRMSIDEIIDTVKLAYEVGYKTIVLQSGEDPYFSGEMIGKIVKRIKKNMNIAVTISSGELTYEEYKHIKDCGADRYLLKHETSDDEIYSYLHPCGTLSNRLKALEMIKSLGYETGSGFMIGLFNQTTDTIAKDILTLKKIPCDMAGIGPFIAHKDTPLKNMPNGSTELTKRAVALTRILLPKSNLPATTSLGVINAKEKDDIFSCGANVIMRKVTPQKYEQYYEIYPSDIKVDNVYKERKELENEIKKLGKTPI